MSSDDRRAFVTGGTGFVGSHLVRALAGSGWQTVTCGRGARPDDLPGEVGYEQVDLTGERALIPFLEEADVVFHLAGLSSSIATEEEMYRANVEGTRRLALAARKAEVSRFLHVSTTSVYGKEVQLPQPVPEDVTPHPSPGYAESKWLGEEALREVGAEGLATTVLRPVTVYGPGAIKLVASTILDAAIEAWAGLDTFAVPADPAELRLVHVDDVVAALLHLADHGDAVGRAFNLSDGVYQSSHEVGGVIADQFDLELEPTEDPDRGLSYERRGEVREQMMAEGMREGILLKDRRIRLLKKRNPNNRVSMQALASVGFEPSVTDVSESIPDSVAWYREQRWIL